MGEPHECIGYAEIDLGDEVGPKLRIAVFRPGRFEVATWKPNWHTHENGQQFHRFIGDMLLTPIYMDMGARGPTPGTLDAETFLRVASTTARGFIFGERKAGRLTRSDGRWTWQPPAPSSKGGTA